MGFGPRARDREAARTAIRELIEVLYPERATPGALRVLDQMATLLIDNGAPLSFRSMARLLGNPDWRGSLLTRSPDTCAFFAPYAGRAIDAEWLDPDFAWLLCDRLQADPDGDSPF
jgi:hypothetical protein